MFQTQIFSLDVPKGKCTLSKENKTGRHVVPTFHSLFECVFEEGTPRRFDACECVLDISACTLAIQTCKYAGAYAHVFVNKRVYICGNVYVV